MDRLRLARPSGRPGLGKQPHRTALPAGAPGIAAIKDFVGQTLPQARRDETTASDART